MSCLSIARVTSLCTHASSRRRLHWFQSLDPTRSTAWCAARPTSGQYFTTHASEGTTGRSHMDALRSYIEGQYVSVAIDLCDADWLARAEVPAEPGWYYIETTAPLDVLARQTLWQRRHSQKRSGKVVSVKNYDLAARCAQY